MIPVVLAEIPRFSQAEYHPTQIGCYAKITEEIAQFLKSGKVQTCLDEIMEREGIREGEVEKIRVMRVPSRLSKREVKEGRLIIQEYHGRISVSRGRIDIYPELRWSDREKALPRKHITHVLSKVQRRSMRLGAEAAVHEILHVRYGREDEAEVRRLAHQYASELLYSLSRSFKPSAEVTALMSGTERKTNP